MVLALKVLLLEDNANDAELMLYVLQDAGFQCTHHRVETEEKFREEIENNLPNLILSDYSLPKFDGMRALVIASKLCPEVPFIFVSGTIGHEVVIQALKSGATDYVLKHDMARLPPTVERAMEAAKVRNEQFHVQAALRHSEQRFHLAASTGDVWDWTVGTGEAYISPQWKERLGYQDQEIGNTAEAWLGLLEPSDRQMVLAAFSSHLRQRTPYDVEYRARTKSGGFRWSHAKGQAVWDKHGMATYMAGSVVDITDRKLAELKIQRMNRVYAVLSGINSLIVRVKDQQALFLGACQIAVDAGRFELAWIGLTDRIGHCVRPVAWSGAGEDYIASLQLGLDSSDSRSYGWVGEAVAKQSAMVVQDVGLDRRIACVNDALARNLRSLAVFPLLIDQTTVAVIKLYSRETDFFDDEEMKLLRELAGDIAFALDHLAKSEKLNYLAYYDTLTNLPNRSLFLDRLGQLTQAAMHDPYGQGHLALVVMNIERFKNINDTLGRQVGDALLKIVAQRLIAVLGSADRLARVGSDQFAAIMMYRSEPSEVAHVLADQVLAALNRPIDIVGKELYLTFRVGVALFPGDGANAETLIANAEAASRTAGVAEGRYQFYASPMNARILVKLNIENRLHRALERDEFLVYYQPKVSLQNGQMTGMEALLRWIDPEAGLVSPTAFISILEETGMIIDVGRWVLEKAVADFRAWKNIGLEVPRIAVNVSAVQMRRKDFLKTLENALLRGGNEQGFLDLELTESLLMDDVDTSARLFCAIREMGVKLAIDDFGTGYSSLGYLKRFSIDYLKIDQSFVREVTSDPDAASICTAIIDLAHNLKLKVIAEGVETDGQMNYLRRRHCDEMQGYYFSRPQPHDKLEALLVRQAALAMPSLDSSDRRAVLVVDDEPGILSSMRRLLRHDGYEIFTANSGREGFDILARNDIQVILCDQRMPEMNGTEFLSRVRLLYPNTIRIVLSGYTDLESISGAINRGAIYKFLTKPWDDELLRENIREAFRHHDAGWRKP